MGTCHKCAAPLGRGTPRHAQCPTCGLTYHTSDCGGRYASCPEIKASLEDCPKCNKVCLCTGGALLCHVGRSRIRRRTAKAARTSNPGHPGLDQFGTPWGYPGVGTLLPRHELKPASLAHFGVGDVALGGAFLSQSVGLVRGAAPGLARAMTQGVSPAEIAALAALRGGAGGLGGIGGLGGMGGLGSMGGLPGLGGGFDPESHGAMGGLSGLESARVLAAVNVALRQQISELRQSTILLARHLERETPCVACQSARSARMNGGGGSSFETRDTGDGSRAASALTHLEGQRFQNPLPVSLAAAGLGNGLGQLPQLPGASLQLAHVQHAQLLRAAQGTHARAMRTAGLEAKRGGVGGAVPILPRTTPPPPSATPVDVPKRNTPETVVGTKRKSPERETNGEPDTKTSDGDEK